MERALRLAEATAGLASPNPQVGCVLVRDGVVLGEGAHRYALTDHAEIVALKQAAAAGHGLPGATAYVTLEPCSHHGRTGPCADALIAAGVARVVVATADPNPLVSGRGLARLRAAGVDVTVGVGQEKARRINDAFALSITSRRPHVTLKAALSIDGALAPAEPLRRPGQPFWLTGAEARAEVHRLRHQADAVLTGIGTVLADDPLLTDRSGLDRRRPLLRVVLDTHLRMPLESKLVRTAAADLCVFCSEQAERDKPETCHEFESRGAICSTVPDGKRLDLPAVLAALYSLEVTGLLLEGGSQINGAFLAAGLVDRVVLFYAETELGPGALPFARTAAGPVSPFALQQRLLRLERRTFGADVMVAGDLHGDAWPGVAEA